MEEFLGEKPGGAVHHPAHYNRHPSGVECIDLVEQLPFNLGNAVKYMWRAGLKEPERSVEDLKKCIWYLERELQRTSANEARGRDFWSTPWSVRARWLAKKVRRAEVGTPFGAVVECVVDAMDACSVYRIRTPEQVAGEYCEAVRAATEAASVALRQATFA